MMGKIGCMRFAFLCFLTAFSAALCEEVYPENHMVNFSKVPMCELIRFVSKVAKINFIFDETKLNFEVSFVSGKTSSNDELLNALIILLNQNQYQVKLIGGHYLIEPKGLDAVEPEKTPEVKKKKQSFFVYKLQYHLGDELQTALKDLVQSRPQFDEQLQNSIQSLQWVKSTNSLLISGEGETLDEVIKLVQSLDQPKKQVFIEVLVIETDLRNGLEFGLEWSMGSKYKNLNAAVSNRSGTYKSQNFVNGVQSGLKGLSFQNMGGSGFDLGIIGDVILHKGLSFFSLGSLVSALQQDRQASIVLNQKLITQDNQNSKIFVGDNIPFAGSVVATVGSSQQTTSNIEYRDIGVSLSLTPLIGDGDIITLEISEEITEASPSNFAVSSGISGIQTTKTNMVTRVHVPDQHFLVLTGMIRNRQVSHKTGLPCLGGLPLIGSIFSKNNKDVEKRHIVIFVRPQLVHHFSNSDTIANETFEKIDPTATLRY